MLVKESKGRKYISENLNVDSWPDVELEIQKLLSFNIASSEDLMELIARYGELSDILEEAGAWKQIRATQFADKEEYANAQSEFYKNIIAPSSKYFFRLDRKIFENNFFKKLSTEKYEHLSNILKNEIELFREKNIELFVEENRLSMKFGELYSQITINFEGEERTIQSMSLVLLDKDRSRREKAWRLISEKKMENREKLEDLFDELKSLRLQIAKNADFENYRDYAHKAHGRFDYSPSDLYEFHNSIREVVIPLLQKINGERKQSLGVEKLRPWDLAVSLDGEKLQPFKNTEELLSGVIRILRRIDNDFAEILISMRDNNFLDLENRKGKSPEIYNCPLSETGSNFIFMNAVGSQDDVQSLLHESGHAFHTIARRGEPIVHYRNPPTEVCELASMFMELVSLDFLDEFYENENDIKKAKREQLRDVLSVFPGVAAVDSFQHWIYLNPDYSSEERDLKFSEIKKTFDAGVDWSGFERERGTSWLGILHIFEVPFYYIEYAISQLGAIALWKKYKEDPSSAIKHYKSFMKLGYSKPISELYEEAGIKFDFSKEYLEEMMDFVMSEWEKNRD